MCCPEVLSREPQLELESASTSCGLVNHSVDSNANNATLSRGVFENNCDGFAVTIVSGNATNVSASSASDVSVPVYTETRFLNNGLAVVVSAHNVSANVSVSRNISGDRDHITTELLEFRSSRGCVFCCSES